MQFKKTLTIICGLFLFFTLIQSCASKRNLIYFSNIPDSVTISEAVTNMIQPTIEPDDEISIKVATLNQDANVLFNTGGAQTISGSATGTLNTGGGTTAMGLGYIVDHDGNIDFPLVGKIKVAGLTVEQVTDKIKGLVAQTAKDPIINVRILNFKISVAGEVGRPGTYTIPNARVNIWEALILAGDLGTYAQRQNVMLYRVKDGMQTITHLNVNDKALLSSPYFYLQQNDVIYVPPINKLKVASSDQSYNTRWLPWLSALISTVSFIIVLSKDF